ncbi:hypothetical protein BIW11_04920 [Tropilaelaps mercedesae]|uniref:Uncharacterized protein n=1 Tax=Tropilaelaps mercedesae TaxID=418985 RepID=A0A1V9WZP2_9ACAR|nr:hypothetical protein BIW11_04920 [Tropilaelaps mercedesae]
MGSSTISTIPSADVLASPRREPIRKLLWCAVLGPLIYLTIADLRDVIEGYMQYPVSIEDKPGKLNGCTNITEGSITSFVTAQAFGDMFQVIYTYEYKTKDTLEFPDVTICNVNPFKKSRACANDSLLFKSKTFYDFGEEFTLPAFCNDDK